MALSGLKSRSLISEKIERARLSARGLIRVAATELRPLVDGESVGLSGECGAQTRRARVERAVPKFSSPGENHRWREGKRAHELATGKVTVMTVLTQGSGVWFVMLTKAYNAMIQVIWVSGTACRSAVRVPGSNPARGAPLVCVFSCVALCDCYAYIHCFYYFRVLSGCTQVALRLHRLEAHGPSGCTSGCSQPPSGM